MWKQKAATGPDARNHLSDSKKTNKRLVPLFAKRLKSDQKVTLWLLNWLKVTSKSHFLVTFEFFLQKDHEVSYLSPWSQIYDFSSLGLELPSVSTKLVQAVWSVKWLLRVPHGSRLVCMLSFSRINAVSEKSTLWTDASVAQNFQRDLGAIGPYEFQGKFVWTNPLMPGFQENLYGPMAMKARQKSSPRLVLVHGWLFSVLEECADGGTGATAKWFSGSGRLAAVPLLPQTCLQIRLRQRPPECQKHTARWPEESFKTPWRGYLKVHVETTSE